jgi:hypothetical protein
MGMFRFHRLDAYDRPGLFIVFLLFQFGSAFLLTPLEVITTRKFNARRNISSSAGNPTLTTPYLFH